MMARQAASTKRAHSYGEQRTFRGLENFAIRRRLLRARLFLDLLVVQNPGKQLHCLELGCGYWGRNLVALSRDYPGIEFSGVDLSVSKEASGFELIEADLTTWAPQKTYDGVLSLAVAEHLLDPQTHFALIAKCLLQGGLAGLTTPAPQAHFVLSTLARLGIFDREEISDHKLYLTRTGLEALANGAGFTVEQYREFSLWLNQWMLLRKM
ncbi:MAG: class I SAM-dependent methyltransferase [Anaerolineales bacterium]